MTVGLDGASAVAALSERMDCQARSRLVARERGGIPFLEAELPSTFRAVFTTRIGGDSPEPYRSLNLSPRSDDDPESVARNRSKLAGLVASAGECSRGHEAAHARNERLVSPLQVHGTRVVGVTEYAGEVEDARQRGRGEPPCDGLTVSPVLDSGMAALLLFADCVPVILVGEVDMAVVHAGWRGLVGGIVQQGARAMTGPPGMAFVGPSIGPCCFTVGDEVAQEFSSRFGSDVVLGTAGARSVDLWRAVEAAAEEIGVPRHQVVNPRLCTRCNSDLFYSYRADGPVTGRQGCMVWAAQQ